VRERGGVEYQWFHFSSSADDSSLNAFDDALLGDVLSRLLGWGQEGWEILTCAPTTAKTSMLVVDVQGVMRRASVDDRWTYLMEISSQPGDRAQAAAEAELVRLIGEHEADGWALVGFGRDLHTSAIEVVDDAIAYSTDDALMVFKRPVAARTGR
jgi:hypothetical protein